MVMNMLPHGLLAHIPDVENIKVKCLSYYHHPFLSYADLLAHFALEQLYFIESIYSDYHETNLFEHHLLAY